MGTTASKINAERYEASEIIGEILKAHRDVNGILQKDIAKTLKYRNFNYISMIENNSSTVPMSRIYDFVEAYRLPKEMALVMLKYLYADAFRMVMQCLKAFGEISDSSLEQKIDNVYYEMKRKYGISD